MLKIKNVLIIIFNLSFLFGQIHNTIPTNHWIYSSIEKFQVAGIFNDLEYGDKVYSRYEVANQIFHIDKNVQLSRQLKFELQRLQDEFKVEIDYLKNKTVNNHLDFQLVSSLSLNENKKFEYNVNPGWGFSFGKNIYIKQSYVTDNTLSDNENYIGREYNNKSAYQEQIYFSYNTQSVLVKFGRDFIKWGYGKGGNLLISDNSRTFDMLNIKFKSKKLSINTMISQLNKMGNNNRYLTATRVESRYIKNFTFGIGHAGLYGGENMDFDFVLSNPFMISYVSQHNDHKNLNSMLYADFAYKFLKNYRLYGELLIDDYQVDHEVKGDLEPNEIGFILGFDAIDYFLGLSGWAEFTQVRNRTYNVASNSYEKYIHRNEYIAHPLGTDFQSFQIETGKWLNSHIRTDVGYYLIRKGEGTIRGEFTTPFSDDDITIKTGYTENIPFGIIETRNKFYSKIHYEFNTDFQLEAFLGYEIIDNPENIQGETKNNFWGTVSFYMNFSKRFLVP